MSSFKNRKRAEQLIDFAGLQWGKLRPTDVDISLDWGGKTWVFTEIKSSHSPLTVGQRIHLEGLVRVLRAGGRTAHAILAKHSTRAHEDIHAAECMVHSMFSGEQWEQLEHLNKTLLTTMNELHGEHQKEYGA